MSALACPHCLETDAICGHEVRGVYDGVLYGSCQRCGTAWNRWDAGTHRGFVAQTYVDAHNTGANQ